MYPKVILNVKNNRVKTNGNNKKNFLVFFFLLKLHFSCFSRVKTILQKMRMKTKKTNPDFSHLGV